MVLLNNTGDKDSLDMDIRRRMGMRDSNSSRGMQDNRIRARIRDIRGIPSNSNRVDIKIPISKDMGKRQVMRQGKGEHHMIPTLRKEKGDWEVRLQVVSQDGWRGISMATMAFWV